jgi:hypothetical protein
MPVSSRRQKFGYIRSIDRGRVWSLGVRIDLSAGWDDHDDQEADRGRGKGNPDQDRRHRGNRRT